MATRNNTRAIPFDSDGRTPEKNLGFDPITQRYTDEPIAADASRAFTKQQLKGTLTSEEAACVLYFLCCHTPVRGVTYDESQIDSIETGRSMILGWCRQSLLAYGPHGYQTICSEDVANVLAFLSSQKYLDSTMCDSEDMEAAQALIFNWCQRGLLADMEEARSELQSDPEAVAA